MVSVFEGFFSPGKRGIKSRSLSMCALRVCTLLLSRALAILRCRLTPVNRGPRRRVFFLPWLFSDLIVVNVSSMAASWTATDLNARAVRLEWGGDCGVLETYRSFQGLACQLEWVSILRRHHVSKTELIWHHYNNQNINKWLEPR